MANRYAVANGNWSNTATWDGGTLPTSADDVFSNNFTVTIDGTFTVLSISNLAATGITAGGSFTFANGGDLTCTAGDGLKPGIGTLLSFTLNSPNTATIRGNAIRSTTSNNAQTITCSGTGTLNIVGNLTLSSGGSLSNQSTLYISANATINHVGDIINNSSNANFGVTMISSCTYNHTGNCLGGTLASTTGAPAIDNRGGAGRILTYNGTGNHTAGGSPSIYTEHSSIITIVGNVTGTESRMAINNTLNAATINVNGIITAGANQPAIVGLITTFVKVQGTIINQGTYNAIYAGRITIQGNIAYWQYRNALNNASRNLYTVGALNYPVTTNVRNGIVYGSSNEFTGTMYIPSPINIRIGVPVDNTVGTGQLTAEDFLQAIQDSTSDIGLRLKNVATVESVGTQLQTYNV